MAQRNYLHRSLCRDRRPAGPRSSGPLRRTLLIYQVVPAKEGANRPPTNHPEQSAELSSNSSKIVRLRLPSRRWTASEPPCACGSRLRLHPGQRAAGTLHFGDERSPVEIVVDTTDTPFLELAHATRDAREGDRTVRYRVRLVWTVPNFGGRRWWFECPRTRRLVTKLYLPNGGWYFWSRKAYRLGYACQRETAHDRLLRRARKLNAALGGAGDLDLPPAKPKWMRWRTYERKVAALEEAHMRADEAFCVAAQRLLNRLNGRRSGKDFWK
jgi:hypothetical protein